MDKAKQILGALGGSANIIDLEPCITRLRVELHDGDKVDEALLKEAGVYGLMRMGDVVQVIVGPNADAIAEEIADLQ